MSARAVTLADLGAWLMKARGGEPSTQAHVREGFASVESWCVRSSYRTALVAPGQPVLLWVSGGQRDPAAGIHAFGTTTGEVTGPPDDMIVPLRLEPLAPTVLRVELVGHRLLADLEVVRMPAGSNPSYVTREQLAALRELRPELDDLLRRVTA